MLSNLFTQLEYCLRYKHSAAGRRAHVLGCTLCHTHPCSLAHAHLLSHALPSTRGHLSTPLHAHTDLLLTWKSQGELFLLIQILSAHIVIQGKQGPNSTSIHGTVQRTIAHHLLIQLPGAESSFSTCRHLCCLIACLI